ncbi:MAG TPA: glutathione transferase GstA [Sphingomicrobium sp.]|nr:glutathione transferase GstA [Sphingomicrobium sp.]
MMILYYARGACSQAVHIILHEAGFAHDSIRVNLKAKLTERDEDYLTVNPKGAVPALRLDNGEILTENAVVLQYLGDQAGGFLLPPVGDLRRYRVLEWLNFIATELHKGFGPLFKPGGEDAKQSARDLLSSNFDFVESRLGGQFLMGETFTLPDPYLFVMLGWTGKAGLDLGRWPRLRAYRERLEQRPSVRRVLEYEGLVPVAVAG